MQRLDVLNGNMAAALGAALAKPDVIAAYPITPQTPVVEYLTQFAADKKIDAAMSEVESELSAMSVVTGASLADPSRPRRPRDFRLCMSLTFGHPPFVCPS